MAKDRMDVLELLRKKTSEAVRVSCGKGCGC